MSLLQQLQSDYKQTLLTQATTGNNSAAVSHYTNQWGTNDNNAYPEEANTSTGSRKVSIDNTAVTGYSCYRQR